MDDRRDPPRYYQNNSWELCIVAADGGWQTKVNVGSYRIQRSRPDWSADSRKLALTLTEERSGEIGLLENVLPKGKVAVW
ncbi:MAG: hypothetical protein ABSF95_11670 [Verrucomicrobiota bacterium]|jgi:hypothetical protein